MDRKYGQADAGAITASTAGADALLSSFSGLVPYYLVAVAAGVTVWLITRALSKKKG